ncbi:MAG: hypothetical protein ACEPOZ_06440 [Marinifilaceae bacterium]
MQTVSVNVVNCNSLLKREIWFIYCKSSLLLVFRILSFDLIPLSTVLCCLSTVAGLLAWDGGIFILVAGRKRGSGGLLSLYPWYIGLVGGSFPLVAGLLRRGMGIFGVVVNTLGLGYGTLECVAGSLAFSGGGKGQSTSGKGLRDGANWKVPAAKVSGMARIGKYLRQRSQGWRELESTCGKGLRDGANWKVPPAKVSGLARIGKYFRQRSQG